MQTHTEVALTVCFVLPKHVLDLYFEEREITHADVAQVHHHLTHFRHGIMQRSIVYRYTVFTASFQSLDRPTFILYTSIVTIHFLHYYCYIYIYISFYL